jgi:hypothetical protein
MVKLSDMWKRWRENSRQYAIERAQYKAGGGQVGGPHRQGVDHTIKSGGPPRVDGGAGTST